MHEIIQVDMHRQAFTYAHCDRFYQREMLQDDSIALGYFRCGLQIALRHSRRMKRIAYPRTFAGGALF